MRACDLDLAPGSAPGSCLCLKLFVCAGQVCNGHGVRLPCACVVSGQSGKHVRLCWVVRVVVLGPLNFAPPDLKSAETTIAQVACSAVLQAAFQLQTRFLSRPCRQANAAPAAARCKQCSAFGCADARVAAGCRRPHARPATSAIQVLAALITVLCCHPNGWPRCGRPSQRSLSLPVLGCRLVARQGEPPARPPPRQARQQPTQPPQRARHCKGGAPVGCRAQVVWVPVEAVASKCVG